jgi:hypothetical protein
MMVFAVIAGGTTGKVASEGNGAFSPMRATHQGPQPGSRSAIGEIDTMVVEK